MSQRLTKELIAWCTECHWWLPPEEAGSWCEGEDHVRSDGDPTYFSQGSYFMWGKRKLVKRRAYICYYETDSWTPTDTCLQAYFTKEEFDNHEHFSAY